MNRNTVLGIVRAVCISKATGMRKRNVGEAVFIENFGIEGDAHGSDKTHRQVSLLALESITTMQQLGVDVGPGDFAENLTTEGIDLLSLPVGTRIIIGDRVVLEITQHGKKCHAPCAIYRQAGTCVMPREGIFAKVVHGGTVRVGDRIVKMVNGEQ
ncbi:MAG: MOSC domain-containing protein [Desulfobacterota bacterium]|nr:MOSC domain-containing protein [Thermodesulfobacteriota bacterium]